MDDVYEVDSSDETIVINPSEIGNLDDFAENNEELSEVDLILKKYTSGNDFNAPSSSFSLKSKYSDFSKGEPSNKKLKDECDGIMKELNSEDNIFKEFAKKYKKKDDIPDSHSSLYDQPIQLNKNDNDLEETDSLINEIYAKYGLGSSSSKTSTTSKSLEEEVTTKKPKKALSKDEKALEREAAKVLRMQKKDELEKEKKHKEALRMLQKNINPSECLKFITVNIDNEIFQEPYSNAIVNSLQNSDISFVKTSQLLPKLISWTRKTNFLENDKLITKDVEEDHLLLLMDSTTFLTHIKEKSLTPHIQNLNSLFSNTKQLSLGVYGLTQYFKALKNKEKSDFQSTYKNPTTKVMPNDTFDVNRKTVEFALAELQMFCSCYFRALDSHEDIATFVLECTKAVAKKPFKLKKQEGYQQENEWFQGDKKDCIKIDKHGNGLSRLWTQILTMFPLATLETAEAISLIYSSPKAIFQAYEKCETEQEKDQLLQELRVRRAAGPNTSFRKIGPEMSKKAANFFNSKDIILL